MIVYNFAKVLIGFFIGTFFLYFIQDLPVVIISLLQMVFFTLLYSLLDYIYKGIKGNERDNYA